ncbi:MAG: hypothetical protein J6S13_06110 [Clostridia bacterium]|nr:hypothetical protein [Clostridia bacterium]
MGDNTRKNSVEEQRARQKELIELKRKKEAFQENPDEFQHEGPAEAVAQTTRSKLENFWYYSRFTIIGILIIAIIFTIAVVQCSTKPKYDLTVVLYTKTFVDSVMSENLAAIAETYCEDFDGNGEVNVLVVNCAIPDSQRLADGDASTRLLGQFQNEAAIVYIVDKAAYDDLSKSFGDDFLDSSLKLPDLDGTAFQLNGTVFDAAFNKVSHGYSNKFDYYLLRRRIGEKATANKGDVKTHSKNANTFISAVLSDPYKTAK